MNALCDLCGSTLLKTNIRKHQKTQKCKNNQKEYKSNLTKQLYEIEIKKLKEIITNSEQMNKEITIKLENLNKELVLKEKHIQKFEKLQESHNKEINQLQKSHNKEMKQLLIEITLLKNQLNSNFIFDNITIDKNNINDNNKNNVISEKLNELITLMKPKKKYKKQRIGKTLRIQVWDKWIGIKIGMIKYPNCKIYDISQSNFECGHYIPESQGGTTDINNLLPICTDCNKSNGTKTMNLELWKEIKISQEIKDII